MCHEPVSSGGRSELEIFHVGIEVTSREQNQLLRLERPLVGGQRLINDGEVITECHDQESGVGLTKLMYEPGSYSVNISTERSVTSLRQDGARVRPVSVNHDQESGVGSAEGEADPWQQPGS